MGNSSSNSAKTNAHTQNQNDPAEIIQRVVNGENNNNEKKLEDQNTSDIYDTLNSITEFKQTGGSKKKIPLLGGFENKGYLSDTSENIIGGFENKTGRKRYTKYDLFKILKNLDLETEINQEGGNENTDSSLNDDQSMEHIKNIILKELETLKNNKSQQLGGSGCGCAGASTGTGSNKSNKTNSRQLNSKLNLNNIIIDSEENNLRGGTVIIDGNSSSSDTSTSSNSSSSEFGKSKPKSKSKSKSKSRSKPKYNKRQESSDDESSKFVIETSESGKDGKSESESESNLEKKQTSNGEDSEEGLSIFPFNSSDVKSSLSIKNYRMLRRKI